MSRLQTSFVLGYHGCDRAIGEQVLAGETEIIRSERDYDWLGPGTYFWEADPVRAREWAEAKAARVPGMEPFVIGAIIDLGNCLDLTARENIELLRAAHDGLADSLQAEGKALPQNREPRGVPERDKLLRDLDCAVIRYLHDTIAQQSQSEDPSLEAFDTVRGLFFEGSPIYPGSGFFERTHTQIAVCHRQVIKGFFLPPAA